MESNRYGLVRVSQDKNQQNCVFEKYKWSLKREIWDNGLEGHCLWLLLK